MVPGLRRTFQDFIADRSGLHAVTGGPCAYTGKGNPIPLTKEADFNAFVEDLEKSLDKNQVPITTQNRLLRLLAPLSPAASE